MTVKEFIGTLESSDRLRIIEGKAEVYVGYLAGNEQARAEAQQKAGKKA